MRTLLPLATRLCGDRARRNVFEPPVADWQRELAASAGVALVGGDPRQWPPIGQHHG